MSGAEPSSRISVHPLSLHHKLNRASRRPSEPLQKRSSLHRPTYRGRTLCSHVVPWENGTCRSPVMFTERRTSGRDASLWSAS